MSADIRLITLRRRAIAQSNPVEDSSFHRDELISGNNALSMDYFDIINVRSFTSEDSLKDIMDVSNIGSESRDDVSMQSYPIYCNEDTLKKHEKDPLYGDPFAYDGTAQMPFLSIIQVHITPEVLARVQYCNSVTECIEKFYEDIHLILNDFANHEHEDQQNMRYRVYQSLSAGDFAVVIRSQFAQTSFYISTMLRRRTVRRQKASEIPLVLYKTYTVLSIYHEAPQVVASDSGSKNGFVIRCCFANKYWSAKPDIDKVLSGLWEPGSVASLRSLNGRYDFTIELTEEEFCRIFPVIAQYKGFLSGGSQGLLNQVSTKIQERQSFDVVDYLCYLISNGYLSYVNERYLLDAASVDSLPYTDSQIETVPFTENDSYLSKSNEMKYYELAERAEKLKVGIERLDCVQGNLNYCFGLLQKLIHLCQTINGLSDTRIYSSMLLKQLECVLDGIEEYYTAIIKEREESSDLDGLEDYLRKSVCALDSYAQYIRNNNLQSLQTPNYSLQSGTSMEKLLIGYGEFLSGLVEGYRKSSFAEDIGRISHSFQPVLIPALENGELSIEVMFSDVFLLRQSTRRKLMLVKCPTLLELTDVVGMVAAFFHEIAHQFRYESRKDRNQVLVHYGTHAAFWPLIQTVVKELCREVPGLNECREMETVLLNAVDAAFIPAWEKYLNADGHEGDEEQSLLIFQMYLEDMMCRLWSDDNVWDTWLMHRDNFFENLKPGTERCHILNLEDDTVREAIRILKDTENMFSEKSKKDSAYNISLSQIKNAVCFLWRRVYDNPQWEEKASDWAETDAEESYQKCCQISQDRKLDIVSLRLLIEESDQLMKQGREYASIYQIRDQFLNDFHKEAAQRLKPYRRNPGIRGAGEYLGTDDELIKENRDRFKKFIQSRMFAMQYEVRHNIEYAIDIYREETSDIYMYVMLNLTPFGYLNFMAYNIPTGLAMTIDSEVVLRILAVLCSVMKQNEGEDQGMFHCILSIEKGIRLNLKIILDEYQEEFHQTADSGLEDLLKEENIVYTEIWETGMKNIVVNINKKCEELRLKLNDQVSPSVRREKLLAEMLHYQSMCNMICKLIENYACNKLDQTGYERVKADLQGGCVAWKRLRTEMEQARYWNYCEMVGRVLNEPYLLYTENRGRILDQTIDFLQEMYYQNKIECGKQMLFRGKEQESESL